MSLISGVAVSFAFLFFMALHHINFEKLFQCELPISSMTTQLLQAKYLLE